MCPPEGNKLLGSIPALTNRLITLLQYVFENRRLPNHRDGFHGMDSPFPYIVLYSDDPADVVPPTVERDGPGTKGYISTREELFSTESIQRVFRRYYGLSELSDEDRGTTSGESVNGSDEPFSATGNFSETDNVQHPLEYANLELDMLFGYFFRDLFVCAFETLQIVDGNVLCGLPSASQALNRKSSATAGSLSRTSQSSMEDIPPSPVSPPLVALGSGAFVYSDSQPLVEYIDGGTDLDMSEGGFVQEADRGSSLRREALVSLQYLMSVAFSCPSVFVSSAVQLVLSLVSVRRQQLCRQARLLGRNLRDVRNFFEECKCHLSRLRPWAYTASKAFHHEIVEWVVSHFIRGQSSLKALMDGKHTSDARLQHFLSLEAEEQRQVIRYAGETRVLRWSVDEHSVVLTPQDLVLWVKQSGQIEVRPMVVRGELKGEPSVNFNSVLYHHHCYVAPRSALPVLQFMLTKNDQEASNTMYHLVDASLWAANEKSPTRPGVLGEGPMRRLMVLKSLSRCSVVSYPPVGFTRREVLCSVFMDCGMCPSYYSLFVTVSASLLGAHHAVQQFLFFSDGPLSIEVSLMVAVMAASRHRCGYTVQRFASLFWLYVSRVGDSMDGEEEDVEGRMGDSMLGCSSWRDQRERWITDGPPVRFQVIQRWIALAAHQPWMVCEENVQQCLEAEWTIPQLFQITTIVASVLGISSFALALQVPQEPCYTSVLPKSVLRRLEAAQQCVQEEANDDDLFLLYTGRETIICEPRSQCPSGCLLWSSEFDWKETGVTFMEQYYPGISSLLQEEAESWKDSIYHLTAEECAGLCSPSITPDFAVTSVYTYVLNLLGYVESDYPFSEINKVISRQSKHFAQQMVLKPELLYRSAVLFNGATTSGPSASASSASSLSCWEADARAGNIESLIPYMQHHIQREEELIEHGGEDDVEVLSATPATKQKALRKAAMEWLKDWETLHRQQQQQLAAAEEGSDAGRSSHGRKSSQGSSSSSGREKEAQDGGGDAFQQYQCRPVSEDAYHCALNFQREKLQLILATTAMRARQDGVMHLFLYCLSSFIHQL